ncbi:MAG: hypothetical protein DRI57_00540 [Deltaproteobacteria bacterium]|nr:MAG: hypothetical protein DRI57_00540 [Deltaproteobacteria bacterium]
MTPKKLTNILEIISKNLTRKNIPFAVIGAMALGAYGLPRYTADVDLLSKGRYHHQILSIMERLGYTCRQNTDTFAQFDSEMGVFGYIDFMFVRTENGKEMLKRRVPGNKLPGYSQKSLRDRPFLLVTRLRLVTQNMRASASLTRKAPDSVPGGLSVICQ